MHDLDAVFVDVDDFCQTFLPVWKKDLISSGVKQQNKPSCLSASEVMLIMIAFHQSRFKNLLYPLCLPLPLSPSGFPLLIRPSYRFITTYAFSDIRFLKVPRSEKKE
ncbi:hypothetical protein [Candidatus Enterovibrio escicola]|uniref:hypothetical protein n=2 Tax=Candidatus Enterovibrio escicola TaxID=1927127 RepID=UPI001237FBFE|nr:hypothetical protein [Candidatus Enterovibrio escacola]